VVACFDVSMTTKKNCVSKLITQNLALLKGCNARVQLFEVDDSTKSKLFTLSTPAAPGSDLYEAIVLCAMIAFFVVVVVIVIDIVLYHFSYLLFIWCRYVRSVAFAPSGTMLAAAAEVYLN
jgi:hypothetical protein